MPNPRNSLRKRKTIQVDKELFDSVMRLQNDMVEMMEQMHKQFELVVKWLEDERKINAKSKK